MNAQYPVSPAASRTANWCRAFVEVIVGNRALYSKLCIGFVGNATSGAAGQRVAQRIAWLSLVEHCLGSDQRFFGRAGGVDFRPLDVAEVEIFLLARNVFVSI